MLVERASESALSHCPNVREMGADSAENPQPEPQGRLSKSHRPKGLLSVLSDLERAHLVT